MATIVYLLLFVLGVSVGSFVNAFIWRYRALHDDDERPIAMSAKRRQSLSIVKGRSMCTHCKHILAPKDLVPLLSWLSGGGKCRYCGKPIGKQYPIVESLVGVGFVVTYIFWPHGFTSIGSTQFAVFGTVIALACILSVYDLKWRLLPTKIIYALGVAAVVDLGLRLLDEPSEAQAIVLSAAGGVLVIAGLFWVLFTASRGRWIGYGDVRLGVPLGLLAGGIPQAMLIIMLASVLGLVFSVPTLLTRKSKMKSQIPFGPMLLLAMLIVYLIGERVVEWYWHDLLLM